MTLTREQLVLLPTGTKVYKVENAQVIPYWFICTHPKDSKTILMGHGGSVRKIETFHLSSNFRSEVWEDNYESAKQIMLEQHIETGKRILKIYFNDSTGKCSVDAGERLHGGSEGKLQGDSEVQSGDERKEGGDSDAGKSSSGDRQRPDRYDEVFQQLD